MANRQESVDSCTPCPYQALFIPLGRSFSEVLVRIRGFNRALMTDRRKFLTRSSSRSRLFGLADPEYAFEIFNGRSLTLNIGCSLIGYLDASVINVSEFRVSRTVRSVNLGQGRKIWRRKKSVSVSYNFPLTGNQSYTRSLILLAVERRSNSSKNACTNCLLGWTLDTVITKRYRPG